MDNQLLNSFEILIGLEVPRIFPANVPDCEFCRLAEFESPLVA